MDKDLDDQTAQNESRNISHNTGVLLTKSFKASIVSSIGVFGSKRCIWSKSMYGVSSLVREASTALKIA